MSGIDGVVGLKRALFNSVCNLSMLCLNGGGFVFNSGACSMVRVLISIRMKGSTADPPSRSSP
jgi:hypothetical protein